MPCNIGYKTYQDVYLPVPQPKKLRKKVEAPKVDMGFLDKIGETSPEFVDWFSNDVDVDGLLDFALKETLKGKNTKGIEFSSSGGFVSADTEYSSETEKKMLETTIDKVMNEFQMRTLKMIAELLEFETVIREENGGFVIEGEKQNSDNNQVSRYLKISRSAGGQGEIIFEHYSSKEALSEERAKFTVLAQKFGLPINFTLPRATGATIPQGVLHTGHLKER